MEAKLITLEKDAALVEAVVSGKLERRIVPKGKFKDGQIESADFLSGIPYGLPLNELIVIKKPDELAEALVEGLHNVGIWTFQDMTSNVRGMIGVFQSVYGVDASALIQAASTHELKIKESVTKHMKAAASKAKKKEG